MLVLAHKQIVLVLALTLRELVEILMSGSTRGGEMIELLPYGQPGEAEPFPSGVVLLMGYIIYLPFARKDNPYPKKTKSYFLKYILTNNLK
jgi:hypothetical protein